MIGLAIFLTIFVMTPVWTEINDQALKPYMSNEISQKEAYEKAITPVRTFMFKQTGEKELSLFMNMANLDKPDNRDDIPTHGRRGDHLHVGTPTDNRDTTTGPPYGGPVAVVPRSKAPSAG